MRVPKGEMKMKINDPIESFEQLQEMSRKGTFEVKILLGNGIFSRKIVYNDLAVFNYIDDTLAEFENEKEQKNFWKWYFKKFKIIFDGYN